MPKNLVEVLTNCYGEFGVAAAIENVGKLGLSNLELALKPHGGELVVPESVVPTVKIKPAELAALKKNLDKHGVKASSVNGGDDMLTREGIDRVKKRLDIAKQLGTKVLVGSAGEIKDGSQLKELYKNLIEVGDYAHERGMVVAFETHPGVTVNGPGMVQTMRDLNHPALRINFDTGNVLFYNHGADGVEHLKMAARWLGHMHLKDSRGGYREWYFPALGDGGAVNFAYVGKVCNDAGFYGPYSIELEGIKGETKLTLKQRQTRLQRSVDHLRSVGFLE